MPASKKSDPETYTKPEVRNRIVKKVKAGDKGGSPGQWSARKAQLVTQEYEKEGGDYKKPRNQTQKSLKQWGDENSPTLTPAQKKSTSKKKVTGSKEGKQFAASTKARKKASKKK